MPIKHCVIVNLVLLNLASGHAQTLQERLGFSAEAKLLIIHADDLGVAHSENVASIEAMNEGCVNSASIMVPCPWFPEIAEYARNNPQADFGLHLTVTSEWKHLKWGPVLPITQVPTLVNEDGFFYDNVPEFAEHADPEHVRMELQAQIDRARKFGINITHLDTHMGALFATPEVARAYLQAGLINNIPTMFTHALVAQFGDALVDLVEQTPFLLDNIYVASPPDFARGLSAYYTEIIENLPPGLSTILIHTAYDNAEMQAVCIDHPDYGAAWRQQDFNYFTSYGCAELLKEHNVQLITWLEIAELIGPD